MSAILLKAAKNADAATAVMGNSKTGPADGTLTNWSPDKKAINISSLSGGFYFSLNEDGLPTGLPIMQDFTFSKPYDPSSHAIMFAGGSHFVLSDATVYFVTTTAAAAGQVGTQYAAFMMEFTNTTVTNYSLSITEQPGGGGVYRQEYGSFTCDILKVTPEGANPATPNAVAQANGGVVITMDYLAKSFKAA